VDIAGELALGTLPKHALVGRFTLTALASADLTREWTCLVGATLWSVVPMERLRLDASIPFSPENLNALRGFVRPQPRVVVSPEQQQGDAETFAQATTLLNVNKRKDARRYEDDSTRVERWSRVGFVVMALIFVIFVGIVITMMGMLYTRVNHVLDRVDGEQVNELVSHAVASAKNTEETTSNLAKASGVAHALALQVQPSVEHALNSTNEMIDQARDFAVHPQWTISGG